MTLHQHMKPQPSCTHLMSEEDIARVYNGRRYDEPGMIVKLKPAYGKLPPKPSLQTYTVSALANLHNEHSSNLRRQKW